MTGRIFNIQRYSTHDGEGIRTTVFLKGCPLSCFWCHNPESKSLKPELMFDASFCINCGNCFKVCKHGAIALEDGKLIPIRDRCVACGECVPVCYKDARSVSGREAAVDEIMDVIVRDMSLYTNSGGGVTVSGGEPLMQPEFTKEILKRCHEDYGIHTAIETSLFAKWEVIESLLEYLDLLFVDVKAVDPVKHLDGAGVDNTLILENIRRLAGRKPLCVRMPLIPGFNDNEEDVKKLGAFIREIGLTYEDVELLKYNNLGESKLRKLGIEDQLSGLKPQSDERIEELYAALKQEPTPIQNLSK